MTLHCGSRLGLLSFLYEQRHAIAYSLGLVKEIQIAMCDSSYDFGKGLKIESPDSDKRMPDFAQAHEITLFFVSELRLKEPQKVLLLEAQFTVNSDRHYSRPILRFFHPPAFQG